MKRLNLSMRERYIFTYRAARRFGWPRHKAFRKAVSIACSRRHHRIGDIIL